jgi:hypothetical protein
VINRPEGEYPGLMMIDRAPMEIEKIMMIDGGDERNLEQASIYREGSRFEYHYQLQKRDENDINEISDRIKEVLDKKGTSAKDILSKPDPKRSKEIEGIARAVHIVGGKKQEDIVGFIQMLLEKMG